LTPNVWSIRESVDPFDLGKMKHFHYARKPRWRERERWKKRFPEDWEKIFVNHTKYSWQQNTPEVLNIQDISIHEELNICDH
jgi:hypothetical protein